LSLQYCDTSFKRSDQNIIYYLKMIVFYFQIEDLLIIIIVIPLKVIAIYIEIIGSNYKIA